MKRFAILLLFIPILSYSQKKRTAFISYFVPISNDIKKKYFVSNQNIEYYKYCSSIFNNSSDLNNYSSLSSESKYIIYDAIFNKAKNGELLVYQYRSGLGFYGPAPDDKWIGKKQIMKKTEISRNISYLNLRDSIDRYGEPVMDNNGYILTIEYSQECSIDDFIGINFYEEWTFDYKNLTIDKKILYYAPALKAINPETLELLGYKCPFIVENKNLKINKKIATDFYSNTDIFCNYQTYDTWFNNNLEPSVKYPFIKEAMTNENNSYYECSPPYNKKISKIDALSFESFRDSISDDYEPVLNNDGSVIKIKFLENYLQEEINSLGFVENWFFDDKISSFSKEVNGVSLERINFDKESHPIFLIKN